MFYNFVKVFNSSRRSFDRFFSFYQIREWHFFEKEFIKWYNLTLLYFKNTIYKYKENFNWYYDFKTRYLFKCYGCETWHNILIDIVIHILDIN